jgi:hypothetical protein
MVSISLTISAILAILAGLIIIFWPKTLRLAIGGYLLLAGSLRLIDLYF